MSFFRELRRRNVFRVGIAYVLVAWVLLQIVDFVLEVIAAPDWILQVFVLAAVLGLPVVLIISWVFEMTPEGLKRERDVERDHSITPRTGRKLDRVIIATLTLAVVFLLLDKFLLDGEPAATSPESQPVVATLPPPQAGPAPAILSAQSIAVLPFVVMSNGVDDGYFADGLTEEILNALAQLPELLVTARTSAFSFKGLDIPVQEIAVKLGVRHVVEGSVRRSGDRLRVTAQLIRADDGFHLWSENYDSTSDDTIAVQEDIAEKIAVAMDVVMNEEKRGAMRQAGLRDVEAFIEFQKGVEWYGKAHGEVEQMMGLRQANRHFENVLEKVPGYPRAHQLHSDLYIHTLLNDSTEQPSAGVTEQDVAEAPGLAVADYAAAIQNARSAEERNVLELDQAFLSGNWRFFPGLLDRYLAAQGCHTATWDDPLSAIFGYADRLLPRMQEIRLCDPLVSTVWFSEVRTALWSGDAARAVEIAQEGAETAPGEWLNFAYVQALVADDQTDRAEKEISDRIRADHLVFVTRSMVAAARGDLEAMQSLSEQYFAENPYNGFWKMLVDVWSGERDQANLQAAKVDQHPFGNVGLILFTYWCVCGAPFDLSATPNFAAKLEESGLPWPPAMPTHFPLKDW